MFRVKKHNSERKKRDTHGGKVLSARTVTSAGRKLWWANLEDHPIYQVVINHEPWLVSRVTVVYS